MKLQKLFALCGIAAALCLSAGNLSAQDNAGNNGGNNGGRRGGNGGGFQGRGNFDPGQMQQRMMDRYKEDLGFTNDTDWNAVQPLVQKVMEARRDVASAQFGGMGRMFRNRGGDTNGGQRRFGPEPSAEAEALQKAIDSNAPAAQIKTLLEKYRTAEKDKETKLEAAQANLKKVLTSKQEAQAVLLGLLK